MTKPQLAMKRGRKKLLHAVAYLLKTRQYASRQEHYNGALAALELAKLAAKL